MDYDNERTEQEVEETPAEEGVEPSAEVPEPTTPPAEPSLVKPQVSDETLQKLQSAAQRWRNMAESLQTDVDTYQQAVAQLQSEQRKQLLAEFGDNPTVQDLIKKLEKSELAAAKLSVRERRVAHLEKIADAQELAEKYGCSPDDLMEAQSRAEMEGMAKGLARTKTAPQPPVTKKTPAISHIPDSSVTTARRPTDFETVEDRYAKGEISLKEYQEARKSKGLP